MRKLVENWGAWFATCVVLGSIPGAVCWIVFLSLGGIVG